MESEISIVDSWLNAPVTTWFSSTKCYWKEKVNNAEEAATEFMQKPANWLQSLQQEFIESFLSAPKIKT